MLKYVASAGDYVIVKVSTEYQKGKVWLDPHTRGKVSYAVWKTKATEGEPEDSLTGWKAEVRYIPYLNLAIDICNALMRAESEGQERGFTDALALNLDQDQDQDQNEGNS